MTEKTFDRSLLSQFTGSEQYYRHSLARTVLYTDGAQYVAESAGAYWLLDEIALAQKFEPKITGEEFQTWKLTVKDATGVLICDDGNGRVLFKKDIPFTDFPEPGIELWCEGAPRQPVILLPSEH